MRPKLADFATYMDAIYEERDALKTEVEALKGTTEELNSLIVRLEEETRDNEQLRKDFAYWKAESANQKLRADDEEMGSRRRTAEIEAFKQEKAAEIETFVKEIKKLKKSLERSKNFAKESSEQLTKANGNVSLLNDIRSNLLVEISKRDEENAGSNARIMVLEAEGSNDALLIAELNVVVDGLRVESRARISEKDAQIAELTAKIAGMETTDRGAASELKRQFETLRRFCSSLEEEKEAFQHRCSTLEEEKEALQLRCSAVEDLKATLQRSFSMLEAEKKTFADRLKEIEDLFHDTIRLDNVGNGVLLSSGKIMSLPYVLRSWIRDESFDGTTSFSVKCYATSTMAKVVDSPVASDFLEKIVQGLGLDTTLPNFFRYVKNPSDSADPIVWVKYKLCDQLTLLAKLIHMCKETRYDTSFQVNVADNHIVTAKSRVIQQDREIEITLSLGIVNSAGRFSKHRIDFVDNPMGGDETTRLLSGDYHIVNEL
jgi:predicted nuclease with TOPRIM domain